MAKSTSTQSFELGSTVKIGFLTLKVISGKISTPDNNMPDEYALSNINGDKFYRFTPHGGLFKCEDKEEALNGAPNY